MNKSESIAKLADALSKAQSEMQPAKMTAVNPFLKNKYADLGEIIQAARDPLAKNGLAFSQIVSGTSETIGVETILMHGSGEWISALIELPIGEEKGRSLAQNAGAAITYLRRYSLAAILGIYADEDTDGNKTEKKDEKPAEKKRDVTQLDPKYAGVTNADGILYTDIETKTLSAMVNSMIKALKKDDITPDHKDELTFKLEAAKAILATRPILGDQ